MKVIPAMTFLHTCFLIFVHASSIGFRSHVQTQMAVWLWFTSIDEFCRSVWASLEELTDMFYFCFWHHHILHPSFRGLIYLLLLVFQPVESKTLVGWGGRLEIHLLATHISELWDSHVCGRCFLLCHPCKGVAMLQETHSFPQLSAL
jgi:hypothetical protein